MSKDDKGNEIGCLKKIIEDRVNVQEENPQRIKDHHGGLE